MTSGKGGTPAARADSRQVLDLCIRTGDLLLRNGGEIFRVQETMSRIAAAFGARSFQVYVLTNGLFACVEEDGVSHSAQVRMVPLSPVNLDRVCEINELSREIAAGKHTLSEAYARLEAIERMPAMRPWMQVLASAVGSGCFGFLFGGGPYDALISLIAGGLVWMFVLLAGRWRLSKLLTNIAGSALVAVVCLLGAKLGASFGGQIDRMIIGAIVPLLPGVPFTNGIRDYINSDYLSGTIRLIDALLIAGCIAIGVGFVLKMYSYL